MNHKEGNKTESMNNKERSKGGRAKGKATERIKNKRKNIGKKERLQEREKW